MNARKSLSTEAVMEKAFDLAKENGIDTVTYNGLARELGIKPQSMYRYVPDIKTLRVHLLSRFLMELIEKIGLSMEGLAPKEQLKAFAISMYDEGHNHPWYYQTFELMHQYDIVAELKEPLLELAMLVQRPMLKLISDPKEAGRITQMFVAINLGYYQMSMTQFIPTSLADSREMFIKSVTEYVDAMKTESK